MIGMMSGEYNTEEFSAFRPRLVWNRDNGLISARPGSISPAIMDSRLAAPVTICWRVNG